MSSRLMLNAAGGMLWTAVCLWMALAAPRRVQGGEFPPRAPVAVTEEAVFDETDGETVVDTSVAPAPPSATPIEPAAPWIGTAECPQYWIVSSRNASQSYDDDCRRGLEYFEHRPDGSLCPTSAGGMTSQFVPGVPIVVFVHGSFVSWEDNQNESHRTYQWIRRVCPDRPLHVLFFTWPSERQTVLLAGCELIYRGHQAEYNAFHLACLLSQIPDHHPVCLVGHSYGALMSTAAVHLGAGGTIEGHAFPGSIGRKRIRIVLAAAALDHHWLNDGKRYGRALCRAECVLNLRNRHDLALKSYSIFRPFHRRALGASGVTRGDRRSQTCEAKIHDYDVTSLIGCGHFWPNYFNQPQLAADLVNWVYFSDINLGYATTGVTTQRR